MRLTCRLQFQVMTLIDTHTHIYLPEFANEIDALIDRATAKGVATLLLPAIDSSTHAAMLELEQRYPQCMSMMGLHPCSVNQDFAKEIEAVAGYLAAQKFVAVGEIGLDFYWDKTYVKEQYEAFHKQIELALEYNLPIAIHSRNATDECVEVVRQYPGLRGVFHCFSGTAEQAAAVLETGFYLGIGGVVTFKNAGLDKVIAATGIEKVVLETDAPYLAPVPFRGKRNEPAYLEHVLQKLADVSGQTITEVAQVTTENAKRLFNLS